MGEFEDLLKSENSLEGTISINVSDAYDELMLMGELPTDYKYGFLVTFEDSGKKVESSRINVYEGPDYELGQFRTRVKAYQHVMALLEPRKNKADRIKIEECDTSVGLSVHNPPYMVVHPETVQAAQKRLIHLEKDLVAMEKRHKDCVWM